MGSETESMVERVARAMAKRYDPTVTVFDAGTFIPLARAAIEAMRDCDNDMLEAMHSAMFEDKFTGGELPMLNAGWVAALDKALEE